MEVIVQKYGGSSLATPAHIQRCAERVARSREAGRAIIVVVSAMGGVTNRLLGLTRDICPHGERREIDRVLATGEQTAAALVAMALRSRGITAQSIEPAAIGMTASPTLFGATIDGMDPSHLHALVEQGITPVVPGFQALTEHGDIVTLGRGGSDTTATVIAAAWQWQYGGAQCEINTDVVGVHTADPNLVPEARCLDWVSYDAMMELAYAGARVINPQAVEHAAHASVPIMVRHAHLAGGGTVIRPQSSNDAWLPGPAIALLRDVVPWSICNDALTLPMIEAFRAVLAHRGIRPVIDQVTDEPGTPLRLHVACRERESSGVAQAIAEVIPTLGQQDVTMGPALAVLTTMFDQRNASLVDESIGRALQRLWITPRATLLRPSRRLDLIDVDCADDAVRAVHDAIVSTATSSGTPASDPQSRAM
ncbi:MAG: aspartate kinase [Planctomycetota bacterium]